MTINHKPGAYIFFCSNATEDECLQRMLFGGTSSYRSEVNAITIGDRLLLYNYISGRLHGIFVAASKTNLEIEPNAWKGKYPWQVRVNWDKKYEPISKSDFRGLLPLVRHYLPSYISNSLLEKLEHVFQLAQRLPHSESDFREKFPATKKTADGHYVRSLGELVIDNWLYYHRIIHSYEPKIHFEEDRFPDFGIPLPHRDEFVYIELWGIEDKKYEERTKIKKAFYKKHGLKVIELTPSSLDALDDVLPDKLRLYSKDFYFY